MPTSLSRLLAPSSCPGIIARALPFDGAGWVFEPKYDGFRAMLHSTRHGCQLRCRWSLGRDRSRELCERIARVLGGREATLDGEIVALDRQGRPVFRDLLTGRGYLAFAAFDVLEMDGRDLRGVPLSDRKQQLARLLPDDTGPLYKTLTLDEYGRALFAAIRKMDLEGIVAKRQCDPYETATTWYTIENPGYTRGEGRLDPFRGRSRSRRQAHAPGSAGPGGVRVQEQSAPGELADFASVAPQFEDRR